MIVSIVISVCASVISGVVVFLLQRYIKRHEDTEKKRNDAHRKENVLILKSIKVLGELTEANSIAIRDGKTNGELKAALRDYTDLSRELDEFLIEQIADK
ncbi:MAG: hypothetical protein NC548_62465 [Lachnospiraceae bacterium]|nr:hypothetical protein [Lachnospiraceae bacterium]